jgi:hypothetical protein
MRNLIIKIAIKGSSAQRNFDNLFCVVNGSNYPAQHSVQHPRNRLIVAATSDGNHNNVKEGVCPD